MRDSHQRAVLYGATPPPPPVAVKRAAAFDADDIELKRAPTSTMMAASGQATAGRPERR